MALAEGKEKFKTDIVAALDKIEAEAPSKTKQQIREQYANDLYDAIEALVKKGEINLLIGDVAVTVSTSTGAGANTAIVQKNIE